MNVVRRQPVAREPVDPVRQSLEWDFGPVKVQAAYLRSVWLGRFLSDLENRKRNGMTERAVAECVVWQAKRQHGAAFRISVRSLQLWRRRFEAEGIRGLIDRREGPTGGRSPSGRSSEASEYFYSLYHTQSRLSILKCHGMTLDKAKESGWNWPASDSATVKWLADYDDLSLTMLLREGRTAWQKKYMPCAGIDHTLIEPGDLFVCDHHQLDLWCEHEGVQLRPWLTAIQDDRSRCIVGWHLGVAAHQDSILAAMRRAFREWALPRNLRIDNGRDYTSKLMTGVTKAQRDKLRAEYGPDWGKVLERDQKLAEVNGLDPRFQGVVHELEINLIYAIPYSPWSKGTLERWFGTFEDNVGKQFATYCGNNTLRRPECLETIRRGYSKGQKRDLRKRYGKGWKRVAALKFVDQSAVPTLDEVRAAIGEWISVYHASEHRGQGMEGDPPLAVWNRATSLRRAEDQALSFLLQARGIYKVNANGVTFKVGRETLSYGATEPRLDRLRGREVFITLDPDDVSYCLAWTAHRERRQFIARLKANERISPLAGVDALRTASAEVNRRRRVYRRADAESAKRMRTVAQELRSKSRERAQLTATGTMNVRAIPVNVEPVRTGFEGVPTAAQEPVRPTPSRYSVRELRELGEMLWPRRPAETEEPEPKKQWTLDELLIRNLVRVPCDDETTTDEETPAPCAEFLSRPLPIPDNPTEEPGDDGSLEEPTP